MKRRISILSVAALALITAGWAYYQQTSTGAGMTEAADKYLDTLSKEQRAQTLLPYDTPQRVGWHFIPKDERKGLQVKNMKPAQRKAALALLRASLSKVGYDKATKVMQLEHILHVLEKDKPSGNIRDTERYYVTIFGEPSEDGRWGLSLEGHHLSLNFVVDKGEVVSSTPEFYGANPATVKNEVEGGFRKGTRVLAKEEQLAFDLLHALDDQQRKAAVIAKKAPREIRAAGEAQPPIGAPEGISAGKLNKQQLKILRNLVETYARHMPADVADKRLAAIADAGRKNVYFAWAGPNKPGIGHYYRIQGPTFLIEFVNTQPDPAGNPANHIHCIWRDPAGDFAIPIARK